MQKRFENFIKIINFFKTFSKEFAMNITSAFFIITAILLLVSLFVWTTTWSDSLKDAKKVRAIFSRSSCTFLSLIAPSLLFGKFFLRQNLFWGVGFFTIAFFCVVLAIVCLKNYEKYYSALTLPTLARMSGKLLSSFSGLIFLVCVLAYTYALTSL